MRYSGHVACMEQQINAYGIFNKRYEENRPLLNTWAELGRILQYISKTMGKCEVEYSASGYEQMAGFCNHGNEPYSYITCGKFLD